MKEKDKRPTYEPPRARDLSGSSVSGFPVPQGLCVPGGALVYTTPCSSGTGPLEDPATCAPQGLGPQYSGCNVGTDAAQGCISGGAPAVP
jgi:hypothetical protein